MAYYNICPDCGSNLDPGEKCTCMEEKVKHQDFFSKHLRVAKTGQLTFVFDDKTKETNTRRKYH